MYKAKVYLLLVLAIILLTKKGYSSDSTRIILKRNVAFVTFSQKENLGSINYERIFLQSKKCDWSYSIGLQPFDLSRKLSLPVSMNVFTNHSIHHAELDVTGIFYMDKFHPYTGGWKEDFNKQLYFTPLACYRFQKNKGVVFKGGIGPRIVFDPPSDNILHFKTRVTFPSAFATIGVSF